RDNYRFRTPSLRNVAQTAPYMHDGSLKTLEDVVFFYLRGVPGSSPDGQPLDIQARSDLSFSATAELVDFLKALTGPSPQVDVPTLP
ncbi:MAG: cytochrome-c peroxidase, partial [Planctomycetaceae bacterium]